MLFRFFAYCTAAFFTLVLFWTIGWLWFAANVVSMKPQDLETKTDAVIVLTGGDKRVNTGFDLVAEGKANYILISGVNPKVTSAELFALWNGNHSKVLPKVTLDYAAGDTVSNATESKKWIAEHEIKSIRLVTANYHMTRSMLMFHKEMPGLIIYKHPVVPDGFAPWSKPFWSLTFQEYNKCLAAWLRLDLMNKNPSLKDG
ncbi:MAG: YdcF family protein [Micavibrio aeruginosavorus]|uniref:YdcF family protein n=1 Tax=Micavibrio aeruginosavorus TaxID=349221 RepID=A0A2W5N5T6_9BACT|nr:MAG: YdcF family protein [Micavibrio aeruginosavorus]